MKKMLLIFVPFMFFVGTAFAGRSSGCGIGEQMWKGGTGLWNNLSASSTNSSGQSFSITSGTSGCSENDIVFSGKESGVFLTSNFEKILEEVAKGRGEFAASLGERLGCEKTAFLSAAQTNYKKIFTEKKPSSVFIQIKTLISSDPVLSQTCSVNFIPVAKQKEH